MNIHKMPNFDDHEMVAYLHDEKSGLQAFVAIHKTNNGKAVGGTRFWSYSSHKEALSDVLRLSRSMTYKCALADVPFGGAKGVIIKDASGTKGKKLLSAYAKRVNNLNGTFHTGEDVGISEKDVDVMSQHSDFMIGRSKVSGDPSPWAALGVFYAIKGAMRFEYGTESLKDRTVAIKGLGKLGAELCRLLAKEGANIIASDIDEKAVSAIKKQVSGIKIVNPSVIHKQKADIYSPCALGGDLTTKKVAQLNCKMVCGGANNQLDTLDVGDLLHKKGILYVPDYLANAGGLINVAGELDPKGFSRKRITKRIEGIKDTTLQVLKLAKKKGKPTYMVADEIAEKRFKK